MLKFQRVKKQTGIVMRPAEALASAKARCPRAAKARDEVIET